MGEDHNHIYSAIAVKEIVPDSDISILSLCGKAVCSSADRLVNTTGSAKYSLLNSKFGLLFFILVEAVRKNSITIQSLSEVSNIRRKRKERIDLYRDCDCVL